MPLISAQWPTRDHYIPARLFWYAYLRLWRVLALDELVAARAVRVGGAFLLEGTTMETELQLERVLDQAFPEEEGEKVMHTIFEKKP